MSDGGEHPCLVARGKCGHYYYVTVETDPTTMSPETAHELAVIRKRGDTLELKTVQFVRDGGLDWDKPCREGKCVKKP